MLLLCGEAAHRAEPGEDQRVNARLGAAGEHEIGVAALDQLRALANGVRARGTRRHDRVVRPLDPELDRELTARRVYEHVREEERRHAAGPTLAQHVALLHDPEEA